MLERVDHQPYFVGGIDQFLKRRQEFCLGLAAASLHVNQTALDNASAIRVCQPGPVAFQRANVSGGNRREIDVRALPDFGRPRGFNILAADAAPKISGNTSRALRARAKVSFVHVGFSRSAFWGLGLRFISFHLAFVGLAQTDHMRLIGARRENHHVQSISDQT
jgi:hypothetical protein